MVGIGFALAAVSLVGLAFYAPMWALWAAGVGLALIVMLLTGLGICLLAIVRRWLDRNRDQVSRDSIADYYRIFPEL